MPRLVHVFHDPLLDIWACPKFITRTLVFTPSILLWFRQPCQSERASKGQIKAMMKDYVKTLSKDLQKKVEWVK